VASSPHHTSSRRPRRFSRTLLRLIPLRLKRLRLPKLLAFPLVALLVLLVVSLASWHAGVRLEKALQEQAVRYLNDLSQASVFAIEQFWIKPRERTALSLAKSSALDCVVERNDPDCRVALRQQWRGLLQADPNVFFIYYGLENGQIQFLPDHEPLPPDYVMQTRPWYLAGMQTREALAWTEPYVESITGLKTIALSVPLRHAEGHTRGVFSIDVSLQQLQALVRNIYLPEGAALALFDRTGQPLEIRAPANLLHSDLLAKPAIHGGLDRVRRDGHTYFRQTSQPLDNGWRLVLLIEAPNAGISGFPFLSILFGSVLITALTLGLALWALGRQWLDERNKTLVLTDYFSQAAKGAPLGQLISDHDRYALINRYFNRAMRQVHQARQAAEAATQAKSRFLTAASHDLRQPAEAQALFVEILSRTALDANQQQLINNLRAASQASNDMLDSLLETSRIEAGVIIPQRTDFKLQSLLNKLEGEFGPLADARHLLYRSRDTVLLAHSDPHLLYRVLRNLVSNALRYTRHGGVLIGCRLRGSMVWLEVWDTGIGIDPEQQRAIFGEFQQLNNPERDQRNGLGLGLSIVDGLTKILGHRLSVFSRPGRGSLFRISLPLAQGQPSPAATLSDLALLPRDAQFLVIEDDPAIRQGLSRLIEAWGCRCATAESIGEALEVARRDPPSAILSDYSLNHGETGLQAINALRAELGHAVPALLISGDTNPLRLSEAQASGIRLLQKPVPPEQLQRELLALLTPAPELAN